MTTATILTVGSVVKARPWISGYEQDIQQAIVFTPTWGNESAHALLWFPELGDPMVGKTVMPIRHVDIVSGPTELAHQPKTFIANAYTATRRARRVEGRYNWRAEWNAAAAVVADVASHTKR